MKLAPLLIIVELKHDLTPLLKLIEIDIHSRLETSDDLLNYYIGNWDVVRLVAGRILTDVHNGDLEVGVSEAIVDEAGLVIDEIVSQYMDYMSMSEVSFDLASTDNQQIVVILETGI